MAGSHDRHFGTARAGVAFMRWSAGVDGGAPEGTARGSSRHADRLAIRVGTRGMASGNRRWPAARVECTVSGNKDAEPVNQMLCVGPDPGRLSQSPGGDEVAPSSRLGLELKPLPDSVRIAMDPQYRMRCYRIERLHWIQQARLSLPPGGPHPRLDPRQASRVTVTALNWRLPEILRLFIAAGRSKWIDYAA